MNHIVSLTVHGVVGWFALAAVSQEIPVPNGSFEFPGTTFVDIEVVDWEESPKPFWYDESEGFFWNQLVGVFRNTPPGSDDHIPNTHLQQGLFLFALPEVGISQTLSNVDGVFTLGKSYRLSAALIGGGGGMLENVALGMQLYYESDEMEPVVVAEKVIRHSLDTFPSTTEYIDQTLTSAPVLATDSWLGKPIGIRFISLVSPELVGGFWDMDHIRLEAEIAVRLADASIQDGQFTFTILSEPGATLEILQSTDASRPLSEWDNLEVIKNETGSLTYTVPNSEGTGFYYMARLSLL